MKVLVIFVEGQSDKELISSFLPRLFPGLQNYGSTEEYLEEREQPFSEVYFQCIVFGDKQELLQGCENKLKSWGIPNSVFMILCDQDNDDCKKLKENFAEKCRKANKTNAVIRIACQELESWYLGDLKAVELALDLPEGSLQRSGKRYGNPDNIQKPSKELQKITGGAYRKSIGSNRIGKFLDTNPDKNYSKSFRIFVEGVKSICDRLMAVTTQ